MTNATTNSRNRRNLLEIGGLETEAASLRITQYTLGGGRWIDASVRPEKIIPSIDKRRVNSARVD